MLWRKKGAKGHISADAEKKLKPEIIKIEAVQACRPPPPPGFLDSKNCNQAYAVPNISFVSKINVFICKINLIKWLDQIVIQNYWK